MNAEGVLAAVLDRYDGVVESTAWGERGVFYNPEGRLARGSYVLTVKDRDSEHDSASNLGRDDVFRVNFCVDGDTYRSLFGPQPERPEAGGVCATGADYTRLDTLLPHPTYAWASWVCVLSPTRETFADLSALSSTSRTASRGSASSGRAPDRTVAHEPLPSPSPFRFSANHLTAKSTSARCDMRFASPPPTAPVTTSPCRSKAAFTCGKSSVSRSISS